MCHGFLFNDRNGRKYFADEQVTCPRSQFAAFQAGTQIQLCCCWLHCSGSNHKCWCRLSVRIRIQRRQEGNKASLDASLSLLGHLIFNPIPYRPVSSCSVVPLVLCPKQRKEDEMTGRRPQWTAENGLLGSLGILPPLARIFTTHIYTQRIVVG